MNRFNLILLFLITIFFSCKNSSKTETTTAVEGRVPVTVTSIKTGLLQEVVPLNAVSVFRMKSYAKASISGYLSEVNIAPGEKVNKGKTMFVIRSKEAQNIGNSINRLDSSFHFKGLVSVLSPSSFLYVLNCCLTIIIFSSCSCCTLFLDLSERLLFG